MKNSSSKIVTGVISKIRLQMNATSGEMNELIPLRRHEIEEIVSLIFLTIFVDLMVFLLD